MRTRRTMLAGVAAGLAGCTGSPSGGSGEPTDAGTVGGTPTTPVAATGYWYTHPQPTGNRRLSGSADVVGTTAVSFEPDGRPQWLVAHPGSEGSYWTVATADGRVTNWQVADGGATRQGGIGSIPPETQPVVATGPSGTRLLSPPGEMARRTSPLVDHGDGSRRSLYVTGDGDLVIAGAETSRLAIDALRDGRLAAVGDGRYALFTGPTGRYRHGALGDTIEGTTVTVVDARSASVVAEHALDAPTVFEGLQPLVADLDGDSSPEIVTTIADSDRGARIVIVSTSGERLATGPVHEPGWRHQLAVAPFGPSGEPELAVVRKPHVDRVVEYYRLEAGELSVVARVEGVSSHTYGSRILDGAVAADLDDDGRVELLVPSGERDELLALQREGDTARTVREFGLDGTVQSNVTGTALPGGGLAVGTATDGAVHVWQA